ncbi:MAG: hypothetical protein PF480_08250 [Roseovarius sp.]|jgi:hypothetical protein|nr:hypothetical protein [Roseovarius sp.]
MSYQPEPEQDPERLPFGRQYVRLAGWVKLHPITFLFRAWLFIAVFMTIMLLTDGLTSLTKPSERFSLAIAGLGWIVPFAMWIRKRKAEKK